MNPLTNGLNVLSSLPANPELDALIAESVEHVKRMTPAEREAMHAAQRASYVRGEMSWPPAKYAWVNGVKDYCSD